MELNFRDVNHLSVENLNVLDNIPSILQNITLYGDKPYYNHNCDIRSLSKFLRHVIFERFSGIGSKSCLSLTLCVITTLLNTFKSVSVKLCNYKIIETPRRVLIKRKCKSPRKSKTITLIILMIFVLIRSNDISPLENSTDVAVSSFELIDDISSLYHAMKGKPLRLNFFTLLLLAGDIETNPGPSNKPVCEFCSRTIAKNHRFVKCVNCACKFHIAHANVKKIEYDRLNQNIGPPFICQSCLSSELPFAELENYDIPDEEVVLPLDLNDDLVMTDKSSLNIGHFNINGLRSKIDFLRIFLRQHKFDILCLNETKIDSTVPDSEISVPGYTIF